MKRRMFLSTAGTVGLVGTISGTSLAAGAYTSLSTSVSLAEFPANIKTILNDFISNTTQNLQELGLSEDLVDKIVTPVRIVGKDTKKGIQRITYKNKTGQYVSLAVKNGVESIHIANTL